MAYKVSELNDIYRYSCPTLSAVRTLYADWNAILDKKLGYIRYYLQLDGRQVMLYEHHLVAQAAYGETPEGYHVHHVNQQRCDNRAENLEVLSASEHAKRHIDDHFEAIRLKRGVVVCREYMTVHCDHCGVQLHRLISRVKKHNYCSSSCHHAGTRKAARPAAEELSAMLRNSSYEAVGRQFGVTGKAVKKWAVKYGLT